MKKNPWLLIVLLTFLLISCSSNIKTPENNNQKQENTNYLVVLTNLDDNTTINSREISREVKLKGVLLKYQHEGLFSNNSEIILENKNAFYFEYLGEDASYFNGDKMEFNAVLYVPDCIPQAYLDGNGVNPTSGNPFWWYMSTYLNKNINEIRNDWIETINFLLSLRSEKLPMPKAEDVTSNWEKKDNTSLFNYKVYGYKWNEEKTSRSVEATKIEFKMEGDEWVLYCPAMLPRVYVAGGGNISDAYCRSIYWYIETYYHKTIEEVDLMVKNGELESFLDAQAYGEPQESDVKVYANTIVSMSLPDSVESLKFSSVYYYKPGRLSLSDGSAIPDDKRIYFIQEGEYIKFFFPQSLREYIEKTKNVTWNGNGSLLWWLLQIILPQNANNVITDHNLDRSTILKILGTYVNSEGNLVTASI